MSESELHVGDPAADESAADDGESVVTGESAVDDEFAADSSASRCRRLPLPRERSRGGSAMRGAPDDPDAGDPAGLGRWR